jgi:hypothetical protein
LWDWEIELDEEKNLPETWWYVENYSEEEYFDTIPEKTKFETFCEERKWIIENEICKYEEKECIKIDFENWKCD